LVTDDKEKTAAKKRYLAKKAKKHKVLAKAKKAAAPKDKEWDGESDSGSESEDSGDEEEERNIAGPSRIPAPAPEIVVPKVDLKAEKKDKKEKKEKKGTEVQESTEKIEKSEKKAKKEKKSKKTEIEPEALIVDEAAERERRRIEKSEKRANRDHEAKRLRKEERRKTREADKTKAAAAAAKGKAKADAGEAVNDEADGAADHDMEESAAGSDEEESDVNTSQSDQEDDANDRNVEKISPPLLEAFPLPTAAPAPDPMLLSRQGLPQNLENATIVDQSLRIGMEDLDIPYKEGSVKGVGERLAGRLKDMGVKDFFAGKYEGLRPSRLCELYRNNAYFQSKQLYSLTYFRSL